MRVIYSTLASEAVAAAVAAEYDLGAITHCALLSRGMNDVYAMGTGTGRFVVRLSGRLLRAGLDVAAETLFIAHLDAAGVPVAAAMPTREGALFATVEAPDGPRTLVVFRHADGRAPGLDDPADAFVQGVTLARLHDAADRYPARDAGRFRLDLDHLLHRPVTAILALDALSAEARAHLPALASRLADAVGAAEGLSRTRLHGDCHGLNARIADGVAVFIDFDDGGFGPVAYDLAVHLWAQVSFGRSRYPMWHAFVAGYRSVRPIAHADFASIPLFVPIRHLWLMGGFAVRTVEWGSETLSTAWLDRETSFLRAWERERLGPALF